MPQMSFLGFIFIVYMYFDILFKYNFMGNLLIVKLYFIKSRDLSMHEF